MFLICVSIVILYRVFHDVLAKPQEHAVLFIWSKKEFNKL
jgi:hypothetical protein